MYNIYFVLSNCDGILYYIFSYNSMKVTLSDGLICLIAICSKNVILRLYWRMF